MNRAGGALPADAYPVPPAQASSLQKFLDQHRKIRLEPGADYRRATGITVRSGQGIYGAAGTRIGRVIIAPGTTGAVVSGVIPESLEFPQSTVPTSGNCFERFAARAFSQVPLTLKNAVIDHNLFLDTGRVIVDTHAGGKVASNRFIRTMVHGEAPAIHLIGNPQGNEDRNVFLWSNILEAVGDGIIVGNQAEVNFVGVDAENWNKHGTAAYPAMLTVAGGGTVRAFMPQGGDPKPAPGRFMDISAARFELTGMQLHQVGVPAIRIRPEVRQYFNVLSTEASVLNDGRGQSRLVAFAGGGQKVSLEGPTIADDSATSVHAGSELMSQEGIAPTSWQAPVFEQIPDPAGDEWMKLRASAQDSREMLQKMLDEHGLVNLPAGIYYISGPLRLKRGQGIIGAGAARTVIVAKSSDIDVIAGDDHFEDKQATSLVLVDITLQGGRAGIRHDEHGAGRGAQYNLMYMSHVIIRDMAEAGIVISGIYGWDNNLLDNVTFYRSPAGIRQVPSRWYVSAALNGDVAGMNYMDKNVFYRCRFIAVGVGLELTARRQNGLNACVDCRFEANALAALKLTYNSSTVIANSDFIGNGGDPVIASNMPVGVVGSRFVEGKGSGAFLGSDAICEGCTFSGSALGGATIGRAHSRLVMLNSRAEDVSLGTGISGLLMDTSIADSPSLRGRLVALAAGQPTILVPGNPVPMPRLLVEWND